MHLDGFIILAGAIVGLAVGATGMGGGALMTPVLVLLLHVTPSAAVSSDLVASVFMKPVGSAVHLRRGTVHKRLALCLLVGAVPSAFAGAAVLHAVAHGKALQADIEYGLGAALLLAVAGIAVRALTQRRAAQPSDDAPWPAVRPIPTLVIGVVGGFVVGMTSVGSGSLMMVALMFLYPKLSSRRLVGTDLVQSVPLVGAAAIGQAIFGNVEFSVTLSLLIGALPAVYLGARLSAVAPTGLLRAVIAVVLALSGLKLVGVGNTALLAALVAGLVGVAAFCGVRAGARRISARQAGGVAGDRMRQPAVDPLV
ncbi:MAG: sulfite exporter TauE/SafE family protein [Acidimicrobiales bacterium]